MNVAPRSLARHLNLFRQPSAQGAIEMPDESAPETPAKPAAPVAPAQAEPVSAASAPPAAPSSSTPPAAPAASPASAGPATAVAEPAAPEVPKVKPKKSTQRACDEKDAKGNIRRKSKRWLAQKPKCIAANSAKRSTRQTARSRPTATPCAISSASFSRFV